jgi:sec-independent protein translocase protein TatC
MSFGEHLEELRRRLGFALLGVLPILIAALVIGRSVMAFLIRPMMEALIAAGETPLMQVTGLLEQFNSYFYVSLVLTVLVGAPWILCQLWLFIAPGLYGHERRFAYLLAPLSLVLTVLAALFTYYVMLPVILDFFVHWNAAMPLPGVATAPLPAGVTLPSLPVLAADPETPQAGQMWINSAINELRVCMTAATDGQAAAIRGTPLSGSSLVKQELRVSQYIDMVFNFALAFAAGFQMPVVVLVLGWVGIVTPQMLAKYRKHAIMVCAILGAALTPGDPVSMVLLTVPLVMLFEFGILLLKWLPASRVAGAKQTEPDTTATALPTSTSDGDGGGP